VELMSQLMAVENIHCLKQNCSKTLRTKQKINILLCAGQESLATVHGYRNQMLQPVPNKSLEATEHQS
jgi:hypothetical protein